MVFPQFTLPLDFQWVSLYLFVFLLICTVVYYRKNLELQKIIFPLFYAGLFRTNFGLTWIEKIATRHTGIIRFLGYCGIGAGFLGMIVIVWGIIQSLILMLTQPGAESGVALVLPQTTVPGIGFLPFWYWIIALFVLIVIHEFAHGIVARAHGIPVKNSGLGFFAIIVPLIPLAFVEPDEKKMEKAPDYVQYSIFAAGPFSNILTAVIILFLFMLVFTPVDNMLTEPQGVTFTLFNESSPVASLPEGFVIRSLNGQDTLTGEALLTQLGPISAGENITIGNGTHTYDITTATNPDTGRAFLGVTGITTVLEPKASVNALAYATYAWIRGLFKWLGLLSLFIGLANLLPLGPVDGGRMLKTLLESTNINQEKATKIWMFISMVVLAVVLYMVVASFF